MRGRRRGRTGRWLVSLLIVALLPTPLPRVEYHNVRHHDAPGEVCEYHDHLLRWHPDASGAEDVPILHWHWGWLSPGLDDAGHSGADLRLHASRPDDAVGPGDSGPAVVAAPSGTSLDRLDRTDEGWTLASLFDADPFLLSARPTPARFQPRRAPAPLALPLHAWLGRWSC